MNIGVIGFGNLGESFVIGVLNQKIIDKRNIYVCAKSEESLVKAWSGYGVNVSNNVNDIIRNSDIVFFVLKEQAFVSISKSIDKKVLREKIIVSFMAGIEIERIKTLLGIEKNVVRAMPSIAIKNGNGVIGYTGAKESDLVMEKIINKLGYTILMKEEDIEKITAFSACGLGFAAYVLTAFVKAGIGLGFSQSVSQSIVDQTFKSAIEMSDYSKIIATVATNGGATEHGLNFFEQNHLNNIINDAIQCSYRIFETEANSK